MHDDALARESEPSIADILTAAGYPAGIRFADIVAKIAAAPADRLAIEYEDRRISYGEAAKAIGGIARLLESRGIGRGDHVGYMFRGHPHALYTLLATTLIGAVLCPINYQMSGALLTRLFERYRLSLVIADEACFEAACEAAAAAASPPAVLDGHGPEFCAAVDAGHGVAPFLARDYPASTDPALIMGTSGTTGEAKGVVLGQSWAGGGLIAARKWGCFDHPPKVYIALSWGYTAAVWQTCIAFALGGSVVIPPRFSASRLWQDFHDRKCDHIHLMGTMPRMLLNQPKKPEDGAHGRIVVTSAAMPADAWVPFEERFNAQIFECYSSVDSGGCWMTNDGSAPPGSVGRPWKEYEARIVDDDDRDVPDGEIGELIMRARDFAPVVTYFNDPEASAEKVRGGWVHFGDYFRRDAEGHYWFVERKRDLIRRRAMGIAPSEIETVIRQMPGVAECSAIAVPSELGEDEVKLVIVKDSGSAIAPADIAAYSAETLPTYMMPKYIEIVDELPRTFGSERVQRFKLREAWNSPGTWDVPAAGYLGA